MINQKENNKKVLFVCAENAGRSQMAEAFFNFYAEGSGWVAPRTRVSLSAKHGSGQPRTVSSASAEPFWYGAESSGTIPAKQVNPVVVEIMKEKSVDILGASPKKFDPVFINQYERVISFGCLVKEAFSQEVQNKIEDWIVDDPKNKSAIEVAKIRDKIESKVKEFFRLLSRGAS